MFIPMYKKGRALNFGKKYPGIKIETVIAIDPEYVVWCLEHVDHFDLDNELYSLLENELRANEHRRNQEYWTQLRDILSRNEPRIVESDSSNILDITAPNGVMWTTSYREHPAVSGRREGESDSGIQQRMREYLNEWRVTWETSWEEDE